MTAAPPIPMPAPRPRAPDLRRPAEPGAAGVALCDALERLADGMEIFGPPALRPGARGASGDGPLHVAARRGDLGAILILCAAGAPADAPGSLSH